MKSRNWWNLLSRWVKSDEYWVTPTPASSYVLERHRVWQCAAEVAPIVSLPVSYLHDPILGDICDL